MRKALLSIKSAYFVLRDNEITWLIMSHFSLKLHKKIHYFHKKSDRFLIIKVSEKWGVSRDGPKLAANESSEIRG